MYMHNKRKRRDCLDEKIVSFNQEMMTVMRHGGGIFKIFMLVDLAADYLFGEMGLISYV